MLSKSMATTVGFLLLVVVSNTAIAQGHFYIIGAFGKANSDAALGAANRVDGDDNSYLLGAGYALSRNVSVEGAYLDFGEHSGDTGCPPEFFCLTIPLATQADLTGIALNLVGSVPLTDKLEVYGKLGVLSWDIEFAGISSAFNDSGEDVLYGAGLRGSINDNWKVFAEYVTTEVDIDTASIGVSYYF